jgi:hypothetical protein
VAEGSDPPLEGVEALRRFECEALSRGKLVPSGGGFAWEWALGVAVHVLFFVPRSDLQNPRILGHPALLIFVPVRHDTAPESASRLRAYIRLILGPWLYVCNNRPL